MADAYSIGAFDQAGAYCTCTCDTFEQALATAAEYARYWPLSGRRVVASISGGKDSAAMSLHLREIGIEHDRVFMDTGWEHPLTYEYLRGELTRVIGPIVELQPKRDMVSLIRHKAMFPSRLRRFCTQELKIFPMQKYLASRVDDGDEVVNAVGIRAAESASRSKMLEWDWSDGFDCEVWRPLLRWSEQDVIDIHARHGLAPNPLYLKGASRVGCWPCIYARKSEIRFIADNDPGRIDLIRSLEREVQDGQRQRAAAKGTELKGDASWFQAPIGDSGACWPIDRVVAWSRTLRGGRDEDRQEQLFADMNDGCMRWGMCETAAPGGGGRKKP